MKKIILASVLFSLFSVTNFAQGIMPMMKQQVSLSLLGAGWIGAAKPNNDPTGFYLNPSILGYSSQKNHFSLSFMPCKVNWIPDFTSDFTINTFGFNLGLNLEKYNLPISVGFGYLHNKFDYGTFNLTSEYGPDIIGEYNAFESYNVFSFGIGIDYYLLFNFGMSIKPFYSHLNARASEYEIHQNTSGTAYDFGTMIVTPLSKLFFNDVKFEFNKSDYFKPNVNFTLGYAIINIGDEISFYESEPEAPLSRNGRLGYTFDFGFDAQINNTDINLFTYSFTAEVEDVLLNEEINHYESGTVYLDTGGYQSFIGDINIWDNLVLLHSNEKILLHRGHTLNLLETLTITSGNYSGRSYSDPIGSSGFSLSTEGLSKIIGKSVDNQLLKYLIKYFVLEYHDVFIFKGYYDFGTELQGISLHIKNFEL